MLHSWMDVLLLFLLSIKSNNCHNDQTTCFVFVGRTYVVIVVVDVALEQ